jgi:hypothetical protein
MGGNVVVDMMEQNTYSLKGHTNTADSLTFNPVNPTQVLTAGCGIRVFNLPSEKHICFVTRYLDGLIQTVRESEEVRFFFRIDVIWIHGDVLTSQQ